MNLIYKNACINCKKEIESERLLYGLPCKKCLPLDLNEAVKIVKPGSKNAYKRIYKLLKQYGTLNHFRRIYKLEEKVKKFVSFFKKIVGSKPWNAQILWIKKALQAKSFAILAPTGTGKTTFLIVYAIFKAMKGSKIYFVLPTSLLAYQVQQKTLSFIEKANLQNRVKVVAYHTLLKQKEKEEQLNKILSNDFNILITTNMFLSKKFDVIKDKKFDLIIVDDVDSFLKASKNVDKVLQLLGFSSKAIEIALQNVDLKRQLIFEKSEEIINKIKENEKILNEEKKGYKGCLIVSGASARARKKRVLLFRELLNFEIGTRIEGLRNVEDIIKKSENLEKDLIELVKICGRGGLVFVPMDKGSETVTYLEKILNENGIKAKAYDKPKASIINDFVSGNIDVLIGIASYRSPLARGIDLPETIRYAIFFGVPKFRIKISLEEFRPGKLIMLLLSLREYFEDKDKIDVLINRLKKIAGLTEEQSKKIIEAIQQNKELEGYLEYARKIFKDVYDLLTNALKNKEFLEKIKLSKKLEFNEGKFEFVIADVQAYIQASGRTSRLYAGGISKGLSIILLDSEKALNGLLDKIRFFIEDFKIKEFDLNYIKKVLIEVDRDREKIKNIREGKSEVKGKELMKIALMIVESPTKAKTIARFFGIPARSEFNGLNVYECSTGKHMLLITYSVGHVYDLVTQEGYHGILVSDKFVPIFGTIKRCPKCLEQFTDDFENCPFDNTKLEDKIKILEALREIGYLVDEIYVATDPDREGEKIAFDLYLFLKPLNKKIKRLEFHEVTIKAILNALENPREINLNLVNAQLARRIEDRLIGFELSQKLQKEFQNKNLSAGRVQSPVLGWIIKRLEEYRKNVKDFLRVRFDGNSVVFELEKLKAEEKEKLFESILSSQIEVEKIEEKEEIVNPPPPYSTDSILKDASLKLNFSANYSMQLLQDLFESGLITYHRTDSVRVSSFGINIAKEYIKEKFGEQYFVGRSWSISEGAHECIRPTKSIDRERLVELLRLGLLQVPIRLTKDHLRIYDLIFSRFIASQMKPIKVKKTVFKIKLANLEKEEEFITQITEDGFNLILKIFVSNLKPGKYSIKEFDPEKDFFRATKAPLFKQGDVIELMKEKGIGRPSTYSTIIQKLFERKYVIEKNEKIIPTKRGIAIFNYLNEKFKEFISEERTRELENKLDLIEEGKLNVEEAIKEIYQDAIKIKER